MSKIRDAILGYAIGDAFGLPFEGVEREKLINNPVTEMYGDGSQPVDAGTFSANTSMSIATMDSIIKARELDYDELMKCLTDWIVNGKYTVTGEAIDLDKTTIKALTKYNEALSNGTEIDPLECGIEEEIYSNETLQRMIPIAFYSYFKKLNQEETLNIVKDVTHLTNKNEINVIGDFIYVNYLLNIIHGKDKYAAINMLKSLNFDLFEEEHLSRFERILKGDINKLTLDDISSNKDIVSTLESVLWLVLKTENYSQSLIGAVSLGNDTDTIAALTGAITGIIYTYEDIPLKWKDKILKKDYLIEYCKEFERILKISEDKKYEED